MQRSHPKIIYNEEYVDLREEFIGSAMTSHLMQNENTQLWNESSPVNGTRNDKDQVVNTALKKLAKRYNSNVQGNDKKLRHRIRENFLNSNTYRFPDYQYSANSLKSKSELVNPVIVKEGYIRSKIPYPSSPAIQSSYEKRDFSEKVEPFKNKFTMTKAKKTRDENSKVGKHMTREKSLEKLIDNLLTEKPSRLIIEQCKNPVWRDHRLAEKYSLLKVPWKRSYTLPIYPSQPSIILKEEFHKKMENCSDKKTYPYDDGSDIDSMFYREPNSIQQFFGYTFQSQVLALLNISAYICAILILSLIIWIIAGNKLFYQLFLPKPPEHPVKKSIKYVGGAIIYTISSIIKFLGSIFVIPTQQVYHPTDEYSWPQPI